MKTTKEIHEGFRSQALEPEDPNWPINPHIRYIREFFETHFDDQKAYKILDVGSGKSRVSERLKPCLPKSTFTGLDFVKESLDLALSKGRIDNSIIMDLSNPDISKVKEAEYDVAFSTRTMFFLTPEEISKTLELVDFMLKPGSAFLCEFFFVPDDFDEETLTNFRQRKRQYRSLETLQDICTLFKTGRFEIDIETSKNALGKQPSDTFETTLIHAFKGE